MSVYVRGFWFFGDGMAEWGWGPGRGGGLRGGGKKERFKRTKK